MSCLRTAALDLHVTHYFMLCALTPVKELFQIAGYYKKCLLTYTNIYSSSII